MTNERGTEMEAVKELIPGITPACGQDGMPSTMTPVWFAG